MNRGSRQDIQHRFGASHPERALFGLAEVLVLLVLLPCLASEVEGGELEVTPSDKAAQISPIEPTVFFVREDGTLSQQAQVVLEFKAEQTDVSLEVQAGSAKKITPLGLAKKGKLTFQVAVPALSEPTSVSFSLAVNGRVSDRRTIEWKPGRRWRVFIVPIAHHDLGYTDTIENVLDMYGEFYDDVLRFCEEADIRLMYPSFDLKRQSRRAAVTRTPDPCADEAVRHHDSSPRH